MLGNANSFLSAHTSPKRQTKIFDSSAMSNARQLTSTYTSDLLDQVGGQRDQSCEYLPM